MRIWLAALVAAAGGALVLVSTAAAPPVEVAEFVARCGFSHRANDDPIVHPGRRGASHSHDFFGARSTDHRTTARSLRRSRTTCVPRSDRSAYWVPTVTSGGLPVKTFAAHFYYVSNHRDRSKLRVFPRGLRVVAGNARARGPEPDKVAEWSCRGGASESFQRIPECPKGTRLELLLRFPDCWNGRDADSRDHKRHMAYSSAGACPATHPVTVPELRFVVAYATRGGPGVKIASGAGHTAHGDFFDGWSTAALRRRIENCLKPKLKCGADGRVLQ